MNQFPDFMKNPKNKVNPTQLNTEDVEGFYCEGKDKLQMAFWECHSDQKSKKHKHDLKNGILYLKGGDLDNELQNFPKAKIFDLSAFFKYPFFETKKVVHIPVKNRG